MTVINTKVLISQYVSQVLTGYCEGEILLTTSKGTYLQLNGQVLMLTSTAYGLLPIGISIPSFSQILSHLQLEPGQSVRYFDGQLEFPNGILKLDAQIQASPSFTVVLQPERIRSCAQMLWDQRKSKGISDLVGPLVLQNGDPATMHVFSQKAHVLLAELIQGLYNETDVSEPVRKLLGLGVGLTPSGDDVLLGMLYCLLRAAPHWQGTQLLRSAILEQAPLATNAISAAYLITVANGASYSRLDDQLLSLSGSGDIHIQPILEIGSSSGSEMLLGLLLAANTITHRR